MMEPTPPTPRIQPKFDYMPPETAVSGSADVTFAVVGARFENPASSFGSFADFANSMSNDFTEMVLSRGYTVRGPFRTHYEMTYPEKSGSDLVLTATVDFTSDTSQLLLRESLFSGLTGDSVPNYFVSGTVTLGTRVTLVVSESITNELMWSKSVSFDPIEVALSSAKAYPRTLITLDALLTHEDKFYTDLGSALEGQYAEVMRSTWGYLDPNEMRIVKRQSLEVRERAVFLQ